MGQRLCEEVHLVGIERPKELCAMVERGALMPSRCDAAAEATAFFDAVNSHLGGNGMQGVCDRKTTQSGTYYNKSHINLLHYSSEQHTMFQQVFTSFL